MKKNQIEVGGVYYARISRRWCRVRIDRVTDTGRGWWGTNLETNRRIHFKSAGRLHPQPGPAITHAEAF